MSILTRRLMLAIVVFAVCWLAWNFVDAMRQMSLSSTWYENLFLGFVAAAYGIFAAFAVGVLLKEFGLLRKKEGRAA